MAKVQIAESSDRPDVNHGKQYVERHTVIRLKNTGMAPIAKFLEALGTIKDFKTGIYPGPITCNPPRSNQCNQSPAWITLSDGKVTFVGVTVLQ